MIAEEIFKKLGYVKIENDPITYHLVFYDMIAEIKFFKNTFCSGIYKITSDNIYEIFGPIIINNKLFNAIMLQMKELGWLE